MAADLVHIALSRLQLNAAQIANDEIRQSIALQFPQLLASANANEDPQAMQQAIIVHNRCLSQINHLMEAALQHDRILAPAEPITEEQKKTVRKLRKAGWSYVRINRQLNLTEHQLDYAILITEAEHLPRTRMPILTPPQTQVLVRYVTGSACTRRLELDRIARELGWVCPPHSIHMALRRAGYDRYPALIRPSITPEICALRLAWAQDHIDWTVDQWKTVVWGAEIYLRGGKHTQAWVTRKADELRHQDCVVEADFDEGQLFWASFTGLKGKGPCFLWEEEWGPVNKKSYFQRVLREMRKWFDFHSGVALKHTRPATTATPFVAAHLVEVKRREMEVIKLPPASPDLDLMAVATSMFKSKIEQDRQMYCVKGRNAVEEARNAWLSIDKAHLVKLVESMPARCQAVIDADGMYTPYN